MNALKISAALLFLALCTGCADVELPKNSSAGADEMNSSPCACMPLDYDGGGFLWLS